MEDSRQTFSELMKQLDYDKSPNLISKEISTDGIPAELQVIWREAENKLQVDAIYFVANAPVIYFKSFEETDAIPNPV